MKIIIKQVIYLKSTKIGREILKLFQKWYLILRYNIVSSRTLWKLSLELVTTDFLTDIVTNSTDNYILSDRVRRPLLAGSCRCLEDSPVIINANRELSN